MSDRNNEVGSIMIGEGVTVSGKFIVPGRAVVNGSLDGELQAEELLVGAQGKIVGNVRVRRADVYGEVHDTLHASDHLIIRTSGRVNGNASYGEIEIERGGLVQGAVVPAGASVKEAVASVPAALTSLSAPITENSQQA